MAATQDHFDVVIVGAGVHGLCTAKTFLAIDPSLSLLIVDNKSTIGGVWSKEQLYPGLRTNNIQGYFEFSDYPMLDNPDLKHLNIHKRGILPGELVHGYICEYAKRFGLLERTLLKTKVVSAEDHEEDSVKAWSLQLSSETHSHKIENQTITCTKLIVASGLTSQPWLPPFRGVETFQKPCIHTERMGGMSQSLVSDKSIAHVTVVGGGKSAHDAVYLFTKAGKRVTWLIRRTGRGMTPLAKPYAQLGPVSVWLEGILMTRPFTWFGPCPWSDADGFGSIRRFLHSTALGRWIVDSYFENLSAASLEQSGILKEEKTRALVPDQSFMWYGTSTGILTYDDDMYALLKTDRVDFVREDVERLEEGAIILEDGRRLETDAIICATGYNHIPSVQMHPASKHSLWGIPVEHSNDEFEGLESKADSELLERFPVLKSSPAVKERKPRTAPWRLWRFIAPPSQVCSGKHHFSSIQFVSNSF